MPHKVLVKVAQNTGVLESGMIIPESAIEKSSIGEVVAVGVEVCQDPKIEPGVKVLFAKNAGVDLEINQEKLTLLRDADIFLVL